MQVIVLLALSMASFISDPIFAYNTGARIDSIEDILCRNLPSGTNIPHPEFCNVYLTCSEEHAIQVACQHGVYFNPNSESCDPNYTDCESGNVQGGSLPSEEDVTSDEEAPTDEEEQSEQTVPPNAIICPEKDTQQVTFLSHATDCTIYYLCYHGSPIPFQCSKGLHWNQKEKRCAPREVAECVLSRSESVAKCPANGFDFLPHPKLCQSFLFCHNGIQTVQQCQSFYHWDINERKCKLKSLATCFSDVTMNRKYY